MEDKIKAKLQEIGRIREYEKLIGCDIFNRGQLAGAQQALAWLDGNGMEPVKAFLNPTQLAEFEKLDTP